MKIWEFTFLRVAGCEGAGKRCAPCLPPLLPTCSADVQLVGDWWEGCSVRVHGWSGRNSGGCATPCGLVLLPVLPLLQGRRPDSVRYNVQICFPSSLRASRSIMTSGIRWASECPEDPQGPRLLSCCSKIHSRWGVVRIAAAGLCHTGAVIWARAECLCWWGCRAAARAHS